MLLATALLILPSRHGQGNIIEDAAIATRKTDIAHID